MSSDGCKRLASASGTPLEAVCPCVQIEGRSFGTAGCFFRVVFWPARCQKQYCEARIMESYTYMPCVCTRMLPSSTWIIELLLSSKSHMLGRVSCRIFMSGASQAHSLDIYSRSIGQIRSSGQAQLALSTHSVTHMVSHRPWVTCACHQPLGAADSPDCSPVTRGEMQQNLLTASGNPLACQRSRCYAAQ